MTTGSDEALNAESKSMSNRSFLASASRNSLCGSEKWTRTLAVSGLVSTRSTLSQVASRAARVEKKAVSRRFSGTLIRNRRGVKWLRRAAGSVGMRRAGLLGMPVPQPHDFIRGDRVLLGNAQHLFGVVFRACLGHHIAGDLAHLGRSLAAPLVECNPGLEQVLGGWPEIALQSRQDQRRHQAARDTRQHRSHDRPEAPCTAPAGNRFFLPHAQCFSREPSRLTAADLAVGPSIPAWLSCSSSLFASATRSVVSSPIPATVSR